MQERQERRVRALGQEDPLEEEMATHFSTLAWKTLRTEEPGRLQTMGPQRVGQDLAQKVGNVGSWLPDQGLSPYPLHWEKS